MVLIVGITEAPGPPSESLYGNYATIYTRRVLVVYLTVSDREPHQRFRSYEKIDYSEFRKTK